LLNPLVLGHFKNARYKNCGIEYQRSNPFMHNPCSGRIPKKRVIINLGDPQNKFFTKSGRKINFSLKAAAK